jgi:pimeloyl-ACP methyl ester carboxylesterase
MWDDQFEPLAQRYRVVRYDAGGFGKSALPTGGSYAHTDDLKALLEYLDIGRAFILGLSMGGGIAIDFALVHPEATDALIPVDSRLTGWQPDSEFAAFVSALRSRAKEAGIQAARDFWLNSPVSSTGVAITFTPLASARREPRPGLRATAYAPGLILSRSWAECSSHFLRPTRWRVSACHSFRPDEPSHVVDSGRTPLEV